MPSPTVRRRTQEEIEKEAEIFLRNYYPNAWNGKEPSPADHFFELTIPQLFDIKTGYASLARYGIIALGYTNATSKISIVEKNLVDDPTANGRYEYRFTVLHESGHCVMHVPLVNWRESTNIKGKTFFFQDQYIDKMDDPEWQANQFTLSFSMPRHLVFEMAKKFGTGMQGIQAMSSRFDMSIGSVKARLKNLKCIPPGQIRIWDWAQ